jgi:plasmid maintenance system killer protein
VKGELSGYWSVTVGANWRIIFRFERAVRPRLMVDYH